MNFDDLVLHLVERGVGVLVRDGQLICGPSERMTPDLVAAIREQKAALIELIEKTKLEAGFPRHENIDYPPGA